MEMIAVAGLGYVGLPLANTIESVAVNCPATLMRVAARYEKVAAAAIASPVYSKLGMHGRNYAFSK